MKISETMIKASCSPTVYKRGCEYFMQGRVHLKKRGENHIRAAVDDEQIFTVDVEFDASKIKRCFCTCPYYQTMRSPCKHVAAALKQRQSELLNGAGFSDANDRIAGGLCESFAARTRDKERLVARFTLHIKSAGNDVSYGMSAQIDGIKGQIEGIDNFLECYAKGKEFRFDRSVSYIPGVTEFPEAQEEILKILSGVYLDRSAGAPMYTKAIYQTSFSGSTLSRLMPYLKMTDAAVMFNGIKIPDIVFSEDDPDILMEISATDEDITLSINDRGLALTADGEWFLYENVIYHTSLDWRSRFMPVYNAVAEENRMQVTFKGGNRILFVKHILPLLRGRRDVVTQGIDELIVDGAPRFEIYLDAAGMEVSAVVIANYGSVRIRLKQEEESGKIVVRDHEAEDRILSEFDRFNYSGGTFTLSDDEYIFAFVNEGVKRLKDTAAVYFSQSFENLFKTDDVKFRATVDYNGFTDLLEAGFESNLTAWEVRGILSAVRLKKRFYRMYDGRFLDLENDEKTDIFNILEQLDFSDAEIEAGKKSLGKYYALYLDSARGVKKERAFSAMLEKMRAARVCIPEKLDNVLRGYQKTGVMWLKQLSEMDFGGILADDMGLGKTLQVLSYIHGERPATPTLIVTPSALMYNWLNEINRFMPDAQALVIDGPREERIRLLKTINEYEFVITSYPLIRRDTALYKDIEFEYFFIDEAQHIKNPKTMNARAVKRINARHAFAVTGTPVENSLSELWSVFDFIMPGYLYDLKTFRERYEYPIMRGADASCAAKLRARIKPFIMRRMKNEVLNELPERIEETIYADLTEHQKRMYSAFLETARGETAAYLNDGAQGRIKILSLLMRLRQICCHPSLFDAAYKKDSGKLNLLTELTQSAVAGGHRLLIFSQFTSMLSIISDELSRLNISCFYLDGKTPPYERAQMSERFNNGEKNVFLISLKAGGTGLNLVGADTVIHYDPWWNPAVTDQASDRAHRIGQTRAVQIIKLAARGTIEEKILNLQEKKRSLAGDIIKANSASLSSLTDDEIMSLFG